MHTTEFHFVKYRNWKDKFSSVMENIVDKIAIDLTVDQTNDAGSVKIVSALFPLVHCHLFDKLFEDLRHGVDQTDDAKVITLIALL